MKAQTIVEVNCPACQRSQQKLIFRKPTSKHKTIKQFECLACGSKFLYHFSIVNEKDYKPGEMVAQHKCLVINEAFRESYFQRHSEVLQK